MNIDKAVLMFAGFVVLLGLVLGWLVIGLVIYFFYLRKRSEFAS